MQRKLSVLPIVFGVALAFYGDMSFTTIGAFYTLLCVVLAALKAVVGGELLTGDLKLHEIDLLSKMCPLALLQIGLVSLLTGEILLSKRLLGFIDFIYLHICHLLSHFDLFLCYSSSYTSFSKSVAPSVSILFFAGVF